MSLGRKIPVELSETRAARIGRALFERLDQEEFEEAVRLERNPRRRIWTAVAVAIAVAAAVFVDTGAHLRWPWPRGAVEANPSRVVTGATGSHLAFGDMSIDVSPESELVTTGSAEAGMLIVLDRGGITCDVAPRGGRPPFIVQAGGVRVRVVGTRFVVTREGEDVRVDVVHGTIEVEAHGTTAWVSNGESWPPGTGSPESSVAVSSTAVTAALRPGALANSSPPRPSSRSSARTAVIAPSTDSPRPSGSCASSSALSAAPSAPSLATPNPPPVETKTSPPPGTAQELFERAAQIEGHDAAGAMTIYRTVSAGHSAWAANALFAEASLEEARGNHEEARRLLGEYLARYPDGPNARDARSARERLK